MRNSLFLVVVASLVTSVAAHALPLPKGKALSGHIPATFTDAYDFEGIVELSNCSGSLIQFENAKDTDPGLILTNGHCLETGFPEPGTFVYGRASSRSFNLLNTKSERVGRLTANMIVYSTMTKTDLTLYRLTESYAAIQAKYGIRPLILASRPAAEQTPISVVSGYWHRGYNCMIEKYVTQLKEDRWTWDGSLRYSRPGCEVIGGTSGSPVVAAGSRTVVGVNNTINENGRKCTFNNPCEVESDGTISYQKGFGYGQQTYWIYSCLNQNNEVDLSVKGCLLPH